MKKVIITLCSLLAFCCLVQSQPNLYGLMGVGGATGSGTISRFDAATNIQTVAYSFGTSVANDGRLPQGGDLMKASDGKLYGMTTYGGISDMGVIFSLTPCTNSYAKLHDFTGGAGGGNPRASLMQASDGLLYGTTNIGGSSDSGVLFSYNIATGTYTKLHDFARTTGYVPVGTLVQAANGLLYGMTAYGGVANRGTIYSFNPSTMAYAKLFDFLHVPTGGHPVSSLYLASNGMLYGVTGGGGNSLSGVLFSFNPATNAYQKLYDFNGINGAIPTGNPIQASNGMLYGMASHGGLSNMGVIYTFNLTTNTFTKLMDFSGANGNHPPGHFIQATNGLLYGMTFEGGVNNFGVVFSLNPATNAYTKMLDLGDAAKGYSPYGSLLEENTPPAKTWYRDADTDNFGTGMDTVVTCGGTAPAGYVDMSGDCNDMNNKVYPGATELCDNIDNDCDGQIDEGSALTAFYQDYDRDTYGNDNAKVMACSAPVGYVTVGGDCNDKNSNVHPGATELPDNIDNDCDGSVDEGLTLTTFYQDNDRDTYGNDNATIMASIAPEGYITRGGDCNDKNSDVYPGAPELPDNMDNDCDGSVDEGLTLTTFYQDYDRDTYGNDNATLMASIAPVGYVTRGGDCNDKNSNVYPGATEIGDNLDNDCDGSVDEGLGLNAFYHDYDRDTYGNPNAVVMASKSPGAGWVTVSGDCNDKMSSVHPGATEVANGIDDDCDGAIDESPKPMVSVPDQSVEEALTIARIKVSAVPNPTTSRFTLRIYAKNDKLVQVRVLNILGSVVEQRQNIAPNSTLQIGQSYQAGVYFVEVRQGEEREVIKLIKQN